MALSESDVTDCLKSVVDPNTGKDFVSGKALKRVTVEGDRIGVDVEDRKSVV